MGLGWAGLGWADAARRFSDAAGRSGSAHRQRVIWPLNICSPKVRSRPIGSRAVCWPAWAGADAVTRSDAASPRTAFTPGLRAGQEVMESFRAEGRSEQVARSSELLQGVINDRDSDPKAGQNDASGSAGELDRSIPKQSIS